ncbi:mucin-5AC-like isoform X4 [Dreissena polymorpha]|uniref:mucin-5AC-like isoform X3 n=1 Tax=Dreissena polymorpha TaxID=45954 RepID=UPI0022643AAF|nr:mucin-5AC-like isoform X3 [Dreissena polymorpha]XP_052283890.1 mucin-5AC-like isoform X4 [Dreissena polymorpha]
MNVIAFVVVVCCCSSTLGFLFSTCNNNSDCKNGGSCEGVDGFKSCDCKPNYFGTYCEIDPDRCHTHGRCDVLLFPPYYFCHCEHGYHGLDCQDAPATQPTTTLPSTPSTTITIIQTTPTTTLPTPTTTILSTTPTTLIQTTPTTTMPQKSHLTDKITTPPNIVITTTDTPTTTFNQTTPTVSTTTELHMHTDTPRCSKYKTDFYIAGNVISHNALASVCPKSGNHSSPEAFVLDHCTLTNADPKGWKIGHQVMANCAAVPPYTPVIETFGTYSPNTHRSGIFLECLPEPDGFKIAYQPCDSAPTIENVSSSEAQLFYTVN